MHFNKIDYKAHVIFPIKLHHKNRKGPLWGLENPRRDWLGNWGGIGVQANPTPGFRCLHRLGLWDHSHLLASSTYCWAQWLGPDREAFCSFILSPVPCGV